MTSAYSVRWDDVNTRHLMVEHAERRITKAEVEEVVLGRHTIRRFTDGGRIKAVGSAASGRCLLVVYAGIWRMRPVTAWEEKQRECERWQT